MNSQHSATLATEPEFVHSGEAPCAPRHIVSVSLGSASRDHAAEAELLGQVWMLERRGTDGSLERAAELIRRLDGQVGAIGLGGIDIYLVAGGRRYIMRDAARLASSARVTPVVDGSGLKDTLERLTIQHLQDSGIIDWGTKKVLLTCAVDRFGMAEQLVKCGADVTFGDFLFILGLPLPLRSLAAVRRLASVILPVACRLPFKMLYPTGEKQTQIVEKPAVTKLFATTDVVAGDFLLIRRHLPASLAGKIVLTNTVTAADVELLRDRGAVCLITTTPEFDGRSFGTNVMEGIFAARGAKTPQDYESLLRQLNWKPRILWLQTGIEAPGSMAAAN